MVIITVGGHNISCEQPKACSSGLLIPVWQPQSGIGVATIVFRALIYFIALAYMFFGVSIVADRFMAAIEVITSQEREVKMKKITGEPYTILIRVWNETVSNLTLMALGSSAPEILLSVIEIFGNKFESGELGPSTIVGSAAFNLFIIIAVCIYVVPSTERRLVQHYGVFWVTVVWSTFAYIWLYLIISVFSPGVVQVWEGVLTFLFFPLTVISAYIADRYMGNFGQRLLSGARKTLLRSSPATTRTDTKNTESGRDDIEHRKSLLSTEKEADVIAFEEHRRQYLSVFRKLRAENPDAAAEQLGKLALEKVVSEKPRSRAFYRIQATRKLIGSGDITKKKIEGGVDEFVKSQGSSQLKNYVEVSFDPAYYMCLENIGTLKVGVKCERNSVQEPTVVTVHWETIADSAEEHDDFVPVSGVLKFDPDECRHEIGIDIVDNDVYELDEQFFVRLSQVEAHQLGDQDHWIPAKLGVASTATVVIVDDDHAGAFGFSSEKFKVAETEGIFVAEVLRTRGARGEVSVPFKTVDGDAKAGADYTHVEGVLRFKDGQTKAEIEIRIVNDDEYEKNEEFYLELGEPIWHHEEPVDEEAALGRPVLSDLPRCKIVITEDYEFKNFIDRIVKNANTSIMVGTHSWKQQFQEAVEIPTEKEDHLKESEINHVLISIMFLLALASVHNELSIRQSVILLADEKPSKQDVLLHYAALPWKFLFAFIPPTDYYKGWLCFFVAIVMIGLLTAVIGDLASHFGCTVRLKDSVTAISLVAMGTSVPDLFASKTAALQDRWADSSIANVTGSNAVNVFLGIGIAWAIAAVYHALNGTQFRVSAGNLAFSVTMFLIGSSICIAILQFRRFSSSIRGELGGPVITKSLCALIFIGVWLLYLLLSTLDAYCVLGGF
ncbi:unnamed protein product [Anisakis simplex]|uniref:Sodium/calcium exchanger 1 n=1 Tax=Anisakis simplex TaxID=6269 RepID=A0A0M3K2P2_ANISI|nr:unnamed protein product [Anisakis simplex]